MDKNVSVSMSIANWQKVVDLIDQAVRATGLEGAEHALPIVHFIRETVKLSTTVKDDGKTA